MPRRSDPAPILPLALRNTVRDWLTATYGRAHPPVPIQLIEIVLTGATRTYRLEVDVTSITMGQQRETLYMEVVAAVDGRYSVDAETLVFFD